MSGHGRLDVVLPFRRSPWFWGVLAAKLVASALFGSYYVRELFVPFVTHFIDSGFANPWEHFAAQGKLDAFPYSGLMLGLLSAPQAFVSIFVPGLVHASEPLRLLLVRLPMLIADLAILAVLARWFETKRTRLLLVYWCSPILFYISYVHGQIDAIPSAFLFLCLFFVFRRRPLVAGLLLGLGLGTKLHLLVAVPFVAVALWRSASAARPRQLALFLAGVVVPVVATVAPLLPSEGYRQLVLGTSETARLFALTLPIAAPLVLYVAPAALLLLFLRFAAAGRVNRDLAVSYLAVVFGVLVLLVPPMPGWYYWSIPLVCYFFIRQETTSALSYWLVSVVYVVYYALFWTDPATGHAPVEPHPLGGLFHAAHPESLVFTALQTSVAIMVFWIYRQGVRSSHEYRHGDRPILIGVGGDSASGKHTLAESLRALVGPNDSAQTEGDDYHRWERDDEAWEQTTHLDPRANRMFQSVEDLWALRHGRPVTKPVYDHDTGRFSAPRRLDPRRLTFYVGLHPFFIRRMRGLFDLKIYLDPDEALRRRWKLHRDVDERGHERAEVLRQIEARLPDAERFVHPQRRFADWVVSWQADAPLAGDATGEALPVHARHLLRNDVPLEDLVAELRSVPGLDVRWELHPDMERQVLEVRGDAAPEDLRTVAFRRFPNLADLLGTEDLRWRGGQHGVCQLLLVLLLAETMRSRP